MLVTCQATNNGVWRKAFARATLSSCDDARSFSPVLVAGDRRRSQRTSGARRKPFAIRSVRTGPTRRAAYELARRDPRRPRRCWTKPSANGFERSCMKRLDRLESRPVCGRFAWRPRSASSRAWPAEGSVSIRSVAPCNGWASDGSAPNTGSRVQTRTMH